MAAGVTECLWEMVDVIDVLHAFEAKRIEDVRLSSGEPLAAN